MRNYPAVAYILVAVAAAVLTEPALAQAPSTPLKTSLVGESVSEPAATESASAPPTSSFTLAQAVLLSPNEPAVRAIAEEMCEPGHWHLQMLAGAYFKSTLGPNGPAFDYLPITIRLGRACTTPQWDRPWWARGNFEALVEVSAAPIATGPGSIVVGSSLLLRRNLLCRPDQHCVPYFQAGAGIVYTDASHDLTQREIGQEMEFLLQLQFGIRTRLSPNWTFDIEGGFQHISNAGLADRNGGVNAFGASVGFTYTLPCRR
jgi:Lipid A 3-O-deacylase (PagL)